MLCHLFEDILKGDPACVGLDTARPSHLLFQEATNIIQRWNDAHIGRLDFRKAILRYTEYDVFDVGEHFFVLNKRGSLAGRVYQTQSKFVLGFISAVSSF